MLIAKSYLFLLPIQNSARISPNPTEYAPQALSKLVAPSRRLWNTCSVYVAQKQTNGISWFYKFQARLWNYYRSRLNLRT